MTPCSFPGNTVPMQLDNVRYITVILPLRQFIHLNHITKHSAIYVSPGRFNVKSSILIIYHNQMSNASSINILIMSNYRIHGRGPSEPCMSECERVRACVGACMCVCMGYMNICTYVCMHVYICVHTCT